MVEQRTENASPADLINRFIKSRRDGLSPLTIKNYRLYLRRSIEVVGFDANARPQIDSSL